MLTKKNKNSYKKIKGRTRTQYLKKLEKYQKYKQRRTKTRQHGGFFNRYDFAYAGRDTVNQSMKDIDSLAPKLTNQTSKEVVKVAEARIRQVINYGGQQIQTIAP